MAKHDLCTANIRTNEYTVIHRSPENPIGYAEVEYMRFVLGEEAITDLVVVATEETTNNDVLQALRLKFGASRLAEAFPGTRPRLPLEAPDDVPRMNAARETKKPSSKKTPAPALEDAGSATTPGGVADIFGGENS
jgi:hypothetical protein